MTLFLFHPQGDRDTEDDFGHSDILSFTEDDPTDFICQEAPHACFEARGMLKEKRSAKPDTRTMDTCGYWDV